ncbi:hypothetical protein AVEN_258594-1 [Araneus ventricosus]|uniref:Uncharacterized protein n=1 Tax=Araneus ventricosus TaxID=182803 RepID=A0A4Y2JLI0_ARAVE|nr:hypothetical protein AVEN_258594-1 [Araneus ventricosus]
MTRTTLELALPLQTPKGERLATTYDLTCSRPHPRGIFSGSGLEPGTLRPQSRDLATRPLQPFAGRGHHNTFFKKCFAIQVNLEFTVPTASSWRNFMCRHQMLFWMCSTLFIALLRMRHLKTRD